MTFRRCAFYANHSLVDVFRLFRCSIYRDILFLLDRILPCNDGRIFPLGELGLGDKSDSGHTLEQSKLDSLHGSPLVGNQDNIHLKMHNSIKKNVSLLEYNGSNFEKKNSRNKFLQFIRWSLDGACVNLWTLIYEFPFSYTVGYQ